MRLIKPDDSARSGDIYLPPTQEQDSTGMRLISSVFVLGTFTVIALWAVMALWHAFKDGVQ